MASNPPHDNSYFSRPASAGPSSSNALSSRWRSGGVLMGEQPPVQPPPSRAQQVNFRSLDRQQSAIRLRRLRAPAQNELARVSSQQETLEAQRPRAAEDDGIAGNRRRSSSEPQRPTFNWGVDQSITMKPLPPVPETPGTLSPPAESLQPPPQAGLRPPEGAGRLRRGSVALLNGLSRRRQGSQSRSQEGSANDDCYDSRVVDFLDVIDPEVSTLSSITNIQNSLFVPSLGSWVNRRPTYDLSDLPPLPGTFPSSTEDVTAAPRPPSELQLDEDRPTIGRVHSFSSVLTAPQYAILPNDATLEGWSEEDIKLLNDYVRHMLHSQRSKAKQRLKAFGKYVRQPLGFFVTLYATLITLFGLAWVLFLIGWIYVGNKQLYVINVIDNVLVALFAIVGDGLAPFRAVDTYHMIFVAHYHRKTWKLRKKLLLPKLEDHNDLPVSDPTDLEAAREDPGKLGDFAVLPAKEQARLVHHQNKLAKSHTFFKPHETETHHAFPLKLLIAVVLLLDLHSCLQITLGTCTWSIDWHHRSAALTTTILCCSITANLTAGILISIGDRRTRKKDVIERMVRQELTSQAMRKVQKRHEKEAEKLRKSEDGEGLMSRERLKKVWAEARKSEDHASPSEKEPRKEKDQIGRFDAAMGPREIPEIRIPGEYLEK